jgi:cold shock CspA family protein
LFGFVESFDGGEDIVGGFDPSEGLRVGVMPIDEGADVSFELSG